MDLPTTRNDAPKVASAPVEVKTEKTETNSMLKKASTYVFLFGLFLAPLVFIPSIYAPLDVVKSVFLAGVILVASVLYALSVMKSRQISLPRSMFGYASVAVLISLLVSSFTSSHVLKSLIGQGFEMTTAGFLFLMFLGAFLVSRLVVEDKEMVLKVYTSIAISFVILAVLHIARLMGGADFMTLGILSSVTSSLIGRWYDFAILTSLVGIFSLLGIKFLPLRGSLKKVLYAFLVVTLAILFVVNSLFIWSSFAVVIFFIGLYEYFMNTPKSAGIKGAFSRVSILTLVILVLAVACAWKGNIIAHPTVQKLNLEYGEPALPWQLTLDIASDTLKTMPLFGAGPNRFGSQYLLHKPLEINQTVFWNSEFTNGFGIIPSFLVTQGIVGVLAWCLFLFFFIKEGIVVLRKVTDPLKKFLVTSAFFVALFLWIIDIVYVPSHVILFFTFVFTGIFGALLMSEGTLSERKVKFSPVLYSVIIILLVITLGVYTKKAIALGYFQKAIKALNVDKSTDLAQAKLKSALSWDNSDVYYQALSEVNVLRINSITQAMQAEATQNPNGAPDQKKIDEVIMLITDAVKYTKTAEAMDPTNYYNYLAEAHISELGTTLKIQNAYENTKNAYAKALSANPFNPGLYLSLAQLEAGQNHLADAQQFIGQALQLKQNYTEAVFLLSQIQVANNQIKDAIVSTQFALQLNPNEPLLAFQLGILEYSDKNYNAAIAPLEKAVSLNNQYANARYFLGLSYVRMGRNADAIAQFIELAKTNPDNKEVSFILENLKQGKSPFADVKPPIDNKPEKRKTLPVVEKNGKKAL